MRRLMMLWGVAAALAAASPVLADDGVQIGNVYRDVVSLKTYGSPQVPLPPGEWTLISLSDTRSQPTNIRLLTGYLVQVKDGKFAGRVIFKVPDSSARGYWEAPNNCTAKNIIVNLTVDSGANGRFDCTFVLASGMGRPTNPSAGMVDFYDYVDRQKLKLPATAFYVGYGISDARTYLLVDYFFNPDLEGVKPASVSAWHLDRYKEDPKREAYVEKMKAWAKDWHAKIDAGFRGKLPAQVTAR